MGNNFIKIPKFLQVQRNSTFFLNFDANSNKVNKAEIVSELHDKINDSFSSSKVNSEVETLDLDETVHNIEFKKYDDLSDEELKEIASLCRVEQTTPEGAAYEATLIANRYELHNGKSYGNLYDYVRDCKWFDEAYDHLHRTSELHDDVGAAVRAVLVDGKRVLPAYIDEHDRLDDIIDAFNDGVCIGEINNRSLYKQYTTKIKNKYASGDEDIYTFYCFSNPNSDVEMSDIFGYTSEKNRQKYGDEHYSFDDLKIDK